MTLVRAAILAMAVLLTACQSAPPPAADGKAMTVGDWTVRTGGYVRAETGVVHD
jgi:starvation-inducible outer membrane lipoprotein